jgi:hypothetical protein
VSQLGVIRRVRTLPAAESADEWLGAEAEIRAPIVVT